MQLIYEPENSQVIIEHRGEKVNFSIKIYDRTKITSSGNLELFREINKYLNYLPNNRQDEIFKGYKNINQIFSAGGDIDTIIPFLAREINHIYTYLYVDELEKWLSLQSDIRYPNTAVEKVGEDSDVVKTYVKQDYFELVVLTVGLRLMVPIWGEFQQMVKPSVATYWKEYRSMHIFIGSDLYKYKAIGRLRNYCESFIENDDKHISSASFQGLGSSEIPDWLLSGAIIKRLAVASLRDNLDKGGLVKNIYGHVTNALNSMDDNFGNVKPKLNSDIDDEDSSNLERSRPKQMSTTADVEGNRYYYSQHSADPNNPVVEDAIYQASRIDPTVPAELVMECFNHNTQYHKFGEVCEPMIYIAKFIFHSISESKALDLLKLPTMNCTVFSVCQALCIHWKFYNLAVMFNSHPYGNSSSLLEATGDIRRPQTATTNKLMEILPYKLPINTTNERQKNVGTKALAELKNKFPRCQWEIFLPPALQSVFGQGFDKPVIIDVPPLFIEETAQLLVKIHTEF